MRVHRYETTSYAKHAIFLETIPKLRAKKFFLYNNTARACVYIMQTSNKCQLISIEDSGKPLENIHLCKLWS